MWLIADSTIWQDLTIVFLLVLTLNPYITKPFFGNSRYHTILGISTSLGGLTGIYTVIYK